MGIHDLPTPYPALTHETSRVALIILRRSIQDQIEADLDRIDSALRFLDLLDGDTDIEADHTVHLGAGFTLGVVCEDEGADFDGEPSLGSLNGTAVGCEASQQAWSQGLSGHGLVDLEGEHDGREPDADDEDGHDAEGHTDDNVLADHMGRDEQIARYDRLVAAQKPCAPRLRLIVGSRA